ncbi:MAG: aminopeptidase P N-terminal domain-containing protein [Bacteroidota bacterium]|nr:aminopeptidase P N-terminal domain-containing protein [Bacteroidota bacterium]
MKYLPLKNSLFIKNRSLFLNKMTKNSIAIFNSNDIMPTNADGTLSFRQNNDLFWLSGIDQEESILILNPFAKKESEKEMLFLKETSDLIAIWEGEKLNKQNAYNTSGIKTVFWLDEFEQKLKDLLSEIDNVYLNKNMHSRATKEVQTRDDRFRLNFIDKYPEKKILEVAPIMHNLRSIKSEYEISLLQKACNITENAFRRILKFIKPGVMEYEIEAEIIHEFLNNRATGFAYQPIIGSAKNSCVLHYIDNNKKCNDGDILLMDFGAEYANYAADMTRTIPVNGRFSCRQKNVYNAVLHVMKEAIKMLVPGVLLKNYSAEVAKIMQQELISLKLLDKHDIKKQDPKNPLYKKYFMHGVSHYLGLDVHDVGDPNAVLKEGMVFTCEPGIYILEENLGVRLENDILISSNGPVDLMKNIPIETEEIELLMNKKNY